MLTILIMAFHSHHLIYNLVKSIDKNIPIVIVENSLDKDLKNKLENLIDNPEKILEHKKKSIEWVFKYHDIYNVTKSLYKFYKNAGILVND